MSGKINVKCELRDRRILADTLKKMGLSAKESKDGRLVIARNYMPMEIGVEDITCDTVDRGLADNVKVQYQKNYQVGQLALTGEDYEIVETADKISIYIA